MRRLFIIRKDLHLTPGKLASQVGHCCEAYWTNFLKNGDIEDLEKKYLLKQKIDKEIWDNYVNGIFTKTICEAKNLNKLRSAETIAKEIGLLDGIDYGYINDKCLTELEPENEDGTCTVGIWFRPLPDDIAHSISKKFPLYRD